MSTAVDQAALEIQAALDVMTPEHEGLRDYALLNLTPAAHQEVITSITQYDRRKALLDQAKASLDALVADGYPDLDVREISDVAYQDILANAATIEAAKRKFASNSAVSVSLVGGAVAPKA